MKEPPVVSLKTDDPEAVAEAIRNAKFQPCQLSSRPTPSKLTRVICPTVCLDLMSLGASFLFNGNTPKGFYTLIFITESKRKSRTFNFNLEHNDGYLGFFPPGAVLDAFTAQGYANATLTVPAAAFESSAECMYPGIPESVLKRGAAVRVGVLEQAHLREVLQRVMEGIGNPAHPFADEAVRCQFEMELVDAFMLALQSGWESGHPPLNQRVAKRMKRLKQARNYMTEHLHEPLTLAALCAETGMSRRGVEMLFKDLLGVGPNMFFRHQRLHGSRRSLEVTPRSSGVVKQIALAWGFWHMGHFAREYRALFGESPSATLCRETGT